MHVRIRARREGVGANRSVEDGTKNVSDVLRLMNEIESKATAIEATFHDGRLATLTAAIRSVRIAIEMSAHDTLSAIQIMPCATAALLHIRSELLKFGHELGDAAQANCNLSQAQHASA